MSASIPCSAGSLGPYRRSGTPSRPTRNLRDPRPCQQRSACFPSRGWRGTALCVVPRNLARQLGLQERKHRRNLGRPVPLRRRLVLDHHLIHDRELEPELPVRVRPLLIAGAGRLAAELVGRKRDELKAGVVVFAVELAQRRIVPVLQRSFGRNVHDDHHLASESGQREGLSVALHGELVEAGLARRRRRQRQQRALRRGRRVGVDIERDSSRGAGPGRTP